MSIIYMGGILTVAHEAWGLGCSGFRVYLLGLSEGLSK